MTTFIQQVEGDIVAVAEAAWSQAKAELLKLEGEVLALIKADILALVQQFEAGAKSGAGLTVEQMETALLNWWGSSKPQVISSLSSGAIQLLIVAAKAAVAAI